MQEIETGELVARAKPVRVSWQESSLVPFGAGCFLVVPQVI
jgi:hypothetical protein